MCTSRGEGGERGEERETEKERQNQQVPERVATRQTSSVTLGSAFAMVVLTIFIGSRKPLEAAHSDQAITPYTAIRGMQVRIPLEAWMLATV